MSTDAIVRQNDDVDLVTFLRRLWDAKVILLLITVTFTALSIAYALSAPAVFSATTVITRVSETNAAGAGSLASQLGGLGSLVGMNIGTNSQGQESRAILRSRRLAEGFIVQGELLPTLSPPGEELSLWHAVKMFREQILTIREDETNATTAITIDWKDPAVAAKWANAYVALANQIVRQRAKEGSERNIKYLSEQILQTNVVELQRVMYSLIEAETKTLMLANARAEYAFATIDPAVAPEVRTSPRRKLIVVSGTALGFLIGVLVVFIINIGRQIRQQA